MFWKIIIMFISFIFALVSFEIFLNYSPFEYGTSPVKYDKDIGMWHKKEYESHLIRECYKTKYIFDKRGLVKSIDAYDISKQDVVILGDSYIEALMVQNKNIIHNALSKEFNHKYNFLNYGLSGSSPTQQMMILKKKIDLKNSKYILQFISLESDLMDVDSRNLGSLSRPKVYVEFDSLNHYKIIPPREKKLYDSVGDVLGNYQIYFFVKKSLYYLRDHIINNKKENISVVSEKKESLNLSKNWLYLTGAIYQTKRIIESFDSSIKYKIIITSKNDKNRGRLKKFLEKENIDFIFLNEKAKEMGITLEGFACDSHWNDNTHKNIAQIIRELKFIY